MVPWSGPARSLRPVLGKGAGYVVCTKYVLWCGPGGNNMRDYRGAGAYSTAYEAWRACPADGAVYSLGLAGPDRYGV